MLHIRVKNSACDKRNVRIHARAEWRIPLLTNVRIPRFSFKPPVRYIRHQSVIVIGARFVRRSAGGTLASRSDSHRRIY